MYRDIYVPNFLYWPNIVRFDPKDVSLVLFKGCSAPEMNRDTSVNRLKAKRFTVTLKLSNAPTIWKWQCKSVCLWERNICHCQRPIYCSTVSCVGFGKSISLIKMQNAWIKNHPVWITHPTHTAKLLPHIHTDLPVRRNQPTHISPEISTLKPHQQTLEMMTFRQIRRFC